MLKLYGSTTSPYVRRIRIFLGNREHDFTNMQIFEGKDRDYLMAKNPTLKIPMLEDGNDVIYDSRVIFRYLSEKFELPALTWQQENFLTVIDSINDSLVQLLMLQRSDIHSEDDKLYFRLQDERVSHAFAHLNEAVSDGAFQQWDYPAICLYCLVDWTAFRQLHELASYPNLLDFVSQHKDKIEVTASDPRD